MSDEQGTFDAGQPLTRRELRALQRQQEGLDGAETGSETNTAEQPVAPENNFMAVPEPVIEPAPTPPPVAPVFNQEFKFVAPDLANEQPSVDTGFEAPYRYLPGGATSSANQVDLPDLPTVSPSLSAEVTITPPTSSFATQPPVQPAVASSPQPAAAALPESRPSQPVQPTQSASTSAAPPEASDGTDGLFRIPSSLTGEVATASIVIENSTNPLDIIAGTTPSTGSIPIVRTGSIDIQNPEARPAATTGSIRTQPSTDTSPSTAIITPLKSQTIALTGELGHQRGVRFKPVDPQKYWVLGIGVLMVVVGAGFLASFLLGYVK